MPSLKALKTRIKSIKSTQKITKAMKMVAASKLKKARDNAVAAAPYAETLISLIHNLMLSGADAVTEGRSLLTGTGVAVSMQQHLLIVITSDKGLCGSFNMSIVKRVRQQIEAIQANGIALQNIKMIIIGKKGFELLKHRYDKNIIRHIDSVGKHRPLIEDARAVAKEVLERFYSCEFDTCSIVFSMFRSALVQEPTAKQMIPLNLEGEEASYVRSYEYEPDEQQILALLLPQNIEVQIYRAMLESLASEHAARMTAMDNASRNSSEMIKDLTTIYNRSRQSQITKELIEIISGSESLKSA